MRRVSTLLWGLVLSAGMALALPQQAQEEKKERPVRCTLTEKRLDKCCCEQREGRLYCPLAKKSVQKCCCEPAEGKKPTKDNS